MPELPQIQLRHLRSFVVLAEELHFTRAADRLGLAQQALSKQISKLELTLGVELFHRSTRTVELTAPGEMLHRRIVPLLATIDAAFLEAQRVASGEPSTIRVAHTASGAGRVLELINGFLKEHGTTRVLIAEYWEPEAIEGVAHGRFDAALTHCVNVPEDLVAEPISHEALGVVLGREDPLSGLTAVTAAQLEDRTLVTWPRELARDAFDIMKEIFDQHPASSIYVLEQVTRDTFFADPHARREIFVGQAFMVAVDQAAEHLPEDFAWRALAPPRSLPLSLIYRRGRLRPALAEFLETMRGRGDGWRRENSMSEGPSPQTTRSPGAHA